jgi:hypothetical protein
MRKLVALGVVAALFAAPAHAGLVITEVMQNPAAVSDTDGEWFEIYNDGATQVNLNGYTIADNDNDITVVATDVFVAAGDYAVLGRNADELTNGGVTVDYEYSGVNLANGADELVILDDLGAELDRIEWDGGPMWPDPNGASMSLANPADDNIDGARWFEAAHVAYGDGDFGTPALDNEPVLFLSLDNMPITVERGGLASFDLTLENPTVDLIASDAWLHVLGDIIDVTPLVKQGLNLFAGFTYSTTIDLPVPALAPLGDYTVTVNFGDFAGDLPMWSVSFEATVVDPA